MMMMMMMMIIIIIIIIIRHQSGPDRPVSTSSNSLFKGPPSRLRPFGLQFSTIFVTLLLFVLFTCRSQFDLSFSYFFGNWFCFQLFAISSFILWSKSVYRLFFWKILSRLISVVLILFFLRVQILLPYKRMWTASALCTLLLENVWTKVGLKLVLIH